MKMLQQVHQLFDLTRLQDLSMLTLLSVGISFLLRCCELIWCDKTDHHLRAGGVSFSYNAKNKPTHVHIEIPSSKTDVKPCSRSIKATKSPTCAVAILHRYLQAAKLKESDPLFPQITRAKLSVVISTLAGIIDPKLATKMGTHSLRIGGTTSLASGGRVPGHLIKKFGRWRSDLWEQIYKELTDESYELLANQLSADDAWATDGIETPTASIIAALGKVIDARL